MARRRVTAVDVLGEVRRAMRVLRRVERYLAQQERAAKRTGEARMARELRERERAEVAEQCGIPARKKVLPPRA